MKDAGVASLCRATAATEIVKRRHPDCIYLITPNGTGKTTLLKVISRTATVTEGRFTSCGTMGLAFCQSIRRCSFEMNAMRNLEFWLRLWAGQTVEMFARPCNWGARLRTPQRAENQAILGTSGIRLARFCRFVAI